MLKKIKRFSLMGILTLSTVMCMGNTSVNEDSKKTKLDYFSNSESVNVKDVKADNIKSGEKVMICVPEH